jgi:integrase
LPFGKRERRSATRSSSSPPKSGSQRVVALDDIAVSQLVDHRQRQIEERLAFGPGYDTSHDLVFRHEDGAPVHPELFTERFQKRVAAAGLPHMRFHDLRHLHATLGLAAGVHPLVMSKRLGHANVSITLDTYSHVIPQMDRDAADVVAATLRGHSVAASSLASPGGSS